MVGKSSKKSNTGKTHSNVNYEFDGLIFPSYRFYSILNKIDENLSYFYTPIRDSNDMFNAKADKVEELIDLYEDIKDNHTIEFLSKFSLSMAFADIFPSINDCFIEAMHMEKPNDYQEKRIRKIVRKLAYCGTELS